MSDILKKVLPQAHDQFTRGIKGKEVGQQETEANLKWLPEAKAGTS